MSLPESIQPISLADAMMSRVSKASIDLADEFCEWFMDKPVSEGIDPVVMAKKIAVYIEHHKPSQDEFITCLKELDRESTFKPTAAEFGRKMDSIRNRVAEKVEEGKWVGGRTLVSPAGHLVYFPADKVEEALAQGFKAEAVGVQKVTRGVLEARLANVERKVAEAMRDKKSLTREEAKKLLSQELEQ